MANGKNGPQRQKQKRKGHQKQTQNAHGGGWVLFWGISGPEKHLFVFRFLKTHRLK
jgi:hypothetical protein